MPPPHVKVCFMCQRSNSMTACPRCEEPCKYKLDIGKHTCINEVCANLCYKCGKPTRKGKRVKGLLRTTNCATGCAAKGVLVCWHDECANDLDICIFCNHLTTFTLDEDMKMPSCIWCIAEHNRIMWPINKFRNESEKLYHSREEVSLYHSELCELIASFDEAMSVEDAQTLIYNFQVEYGKKSDEEKRHAHNYERRRKPDTSMKSNPVCPVQSEEQVQGEKQAE